MHEDSWKRSEIEDSRNEGGGSRFKVRRFERGARGEEFAPPLTAEMALKLEQAFGLDADVWLRLQAKRDLWVASRKRRKKIKRLVPMEQKRAA
jgi:hypothetical protein